MDTVVVLMQVGREGDWTDRGLPEVVAGSLRSRTAAESGIEWLARQHPGLAGSDWRLLVWSDVREQPYHHDRPATVVRPPDCRNAVFGPAPKAAHRRRGMLRIAPGPVVHKVRADQVDLADRILITGLRSNTDAPGAPGPWFPAREVGPDTVAVRVTGRKTMCWRGQDVVTLMTAAGEIALLPAGQPVIPVDEQ